MDPVNRAGTASRERRRGSSGNGSPNDSVATAHPPATRTTRHLTLRAQTPWTLTTAAWSAVAVVLPFNDALPSVVRALWFAVIGTMIFVPLLLLKVERPRYAAVWVFAGFATLVSVLLAPNVSTILDNVFVGAQLILLLGFSVFVLTHNAVHDPTFVHRVSIAFLVGQSLSACIGLSRGVVVSAPLQTAGSYSHEIHAVGLNHNYTDFGLMSAIAIMLALRILFTTRKFELLVVAALAVNILGLITSGALTSMLAVAIGLAVLVLSMRDRLGKIAIWSSAVIGVFWLVTSLSGAFDYLPWLSLRYRQVTGQTDGISSWDVRTETYSLAWSKITEDPIFGTGLGISNSTVTTNVDGRIHAVHNTFLRAWYQGGIFLAIAFALIIGATLIIVVRAIVRKEYGGEASVLVVIFVYGSFSPLLEQRHFWLPILVAWASISAAVINRNRASGDSGGAAKDSRASIQRSYSIQQK